VGLKKINAVQKDYDLSERSRKKRLRKNQHLQKKEPAKSFDRKEMKIDSIILRRSESPKEIF